MNFFRKNLRKAFNSWEKRALSIMHRRVDGMEQKLDAALDRDTSMARTQTALLEASIHLTETITAIRNEFQSFQIAQREADVRMEQKLDAALDRDTGMARTQTALLEASSRLTETITAIRNEFQSFQVALAALDQASIARMTRA